MYIFAYVLCLICVIGLSQGRCVKDCKGIPNGDYQSCDDCSKYVTCDWGRMHTRNCPASLSWDDDKKQCDWISKTCVDSNVDGSGDDCLTGENGIDSCEGRDDGDYQSCKGCHVYATCSHQHLYDSRPCPARLVWDDVLKRCEWKSSTCSLNH